MNKLFRTADRVTVALSVAWTEDGAMVTALRTERRVAVVHTARPAVKLDLIRRSMAAELQLREAARFTARVANRVTLGELGELLGSHLKRSLKG